MDRMDGRRRRGEDNRARIVQAMLELIRVGDYSPSAEQVAAKAAVSLRTVFRHFDDMDSLYREIARPLEVELRELALKPLVATDWRGRLEELIERRSGAFESLIPFRRAANVHRHRSGEVIAGANRFAFALREILRHTLPEPLQQGEAFEAADLLMSIEAWMRLREEQGLTVDQAKHVVVKAVRRVLCHDD